MKLDYHLLQSEAYKGLSTDGRALLIACMKEATRVLFLPEGKRPFYQNADGEIIQEDYFFQMNHGDWSITYAVFPPKSKRRAQNAIEELIEAGFIERVMRGRYPRVSSIYKGSDRWKTREKGG